MQLVGVSNSPYFRRAAISLDLLGIPFDILSLSPFMDVAALGERNPVMKVPTLICDNGEQIMDSSLIIQYAESALSPGKSLWPDEPQQLQTDFRAVSLALAALEKCLQIIYETRLRPETTRHQPWLERIQGQCQAAFSALDQTVADNTQRYTSDCGQAGITAAIAWAFGSKALPSLISSDTCPALVALSSQMEALPAFQKYAVTPN